MKKKFLFIVSAIVLAISVSAFVYVKNENNSIKQLFDANVEALANQEQAATDPIWFVAEHGGGAITCTLGGNEPCK